MPRSFAEILTSIDEFYMGKSPVQQTLMRLARRLMDHQIDYAVIGGMALAAHGFVRPTEDVDVLLTPDGLERFRSELVGLGYRPAFSGAQKTFHDTETGVKIEVITEGEYPGDGEPKPVVFPNPARVSVDEDGISVIGLAPLVELKLASGLSAPHRLKDLADVQELIALLGLSRDFAEKLDGSVREEYERLWDAIERARRLKLERDSGLGL